jgi:hypothetical protein
VLSVHPCIEQTAAFPALVFDLVPRASRIDSTSYMVRERVFTTTLVRFTKQFIDDCCCGVHHDSTKARASDALLLRAASLVHPYTSAVILIEACPRFHEISSSGTPASRAKTA